ncbi:Transferase [Sesbania bispinosa]|nr:Transferase [Sesbania bispinosa]
MAMSNGSMLLVRFTLFGCGGTALSISLTHKIADFATLITLLNTWTAACGGNTQPVVPELAAGAALFPPREIPGMSASVNTAAEKFTARRFVFGASKVEELKNRVKSALQESDGMMFEPSRVEVVVALIWRCALLAKTASFKPSVLFQAVNLRPRMEPAVPETAVGNFVWPFAVTVEEESHVELHELVRRMRKSMREFVENKVEKFKEGGAFGVVMESLNERAQLLKKKDNIVVYKCSSWCKYRVLDVNFGWGKAVWMCSVNKLVSNTISLMDTRDNGGVEASLTLNEEEMALLEKHHELLHYALINPSII